MGEDLEMKLMNTEAVKIVSLDIETSPASAYTWAGNMYETGLIEIREPMKILSYSAKWYRGKQETKGLIDYKGYKPNIVDDKRILKDIHKILDDSDIVIMQNGIDFDAKVMNARFLAHGMSPPSPYKVIDTKREAKKYIRVPSYSLNELGKYFGLGTKVQHEGFELWKQCMAGDKKAWKKMKDYNAGDVKLTEKVYDKLKPYMKTHPSTIIHNNRGDCPKCSSTNTHNRGFMVTNTTKYQRAQCQECGGWFRHGKNLYKGVKHVSV